MGKKADLRRENQRLRIALKYYAEGKHFEAVDKKAWKRVGGLFPDIWMDKRKTAYVEDGSLACLALAGVEKERT